jgi:hypothetical protein
MGLTMKRTKSNPIPPMRWTPARTALAIGGTSIAVLGGVLGMSNIMCGPWCTDDGKTTAGSCNNPEIIAKNAQCKTRDRVAYGAIAAGVLASLAARFWP